MKRTLLIYLYLVSVSLCQTKSENFWMHGTAVAWGIVWPISEGYIHGMMFTNEQPAGYPLGIKINQDNKHLLYAVHRTSVFSGAVSLACWKPEIKYFVTPRGFSRTFGFWCTWTALFNASMRKVQTNHYFPVDNQIHGYRIRIGNFSIDIKEPSPQWRQGQLAMGIFFYLLPDIVDFLTN